MPEDTRQDALAELERLVRRDPAGSLYLPLAERWRDLGRVEEAIRLCEERRARPGRIVGDAIVLGRCYLAAGRLSEARAEFEAALKLDRENVCALKGLAGIESHQGAHAAAADHYRAVCRVDPGDLESQTALHQLASGEYSEIQPAGLELGQGELSWQPVRLPREEEHLSELALGLRTIETFDAPAPSGSPPGVQEFRELDIESLEIELDAEAPIPASTLNRALAAVESPPVHDSAPDSLPDPPPATTAGPPAPARVPEPGPTLGPEPPAGGAVEGNRSAFEIWIRRLGSWESR